MQLIFLLSLPRSGSTLAQRILAAHPDIATASEPWLLLPLVSALRDDLGTAEYGHRQAVRALREFLKGIAGGRDLGRELLRASALCIYRQAAGDRAFFLDKTPRYHMIVDDIMDLFPEAKYIFLWRNPLAIAASILNTWSDDGRWNLYRYKVDLYKGLASLVQAASARRGANTFAMRYEDIVLAPERTWKGAFEFLGLDFDPKVLRAFKDVHLAGRMGDPTGQEKYQTISSDSLETWGDSFFNPLRRRWALSYLTWIGSDRLSFMGYKCSELRTPLQNNRQVFERLAEDALFLTWGAAHALFDLPGLRVRLSAIARNEVVFPRT